MVKHAGGSQLDPAAPFQQGSGWIQPSDPFVDGHYPIYTGSQHEKPLVFLLACHSFIKTMLTRQYSSVIKTHPWILVGGYSQPNISINCRQDSVLKIHGFWK